MKRIIRLFLLLMILIPCMTFALSKDYKDVVSKYYEEVEHMPKERSGMLWCIYGPKADESLADDSVVIEEGFCYEENT